MNHTKIEWTDATLNPVVGCTHGCSYCYARRQAKRFKQRCEQCYSFKPHAHLERLEQLTPRQKPKRIFIDSMWDWNCRANDPGWMIAVIRKMRECSQHTFQILSKRPRGYRRWSFPENVWIGTTITNKQDSLRAQELLLNTHPDSTLFLSFEPLLGAIELYWDLGLHVGDFDWVIVGGQTGPGAVAPNPDWVRSILGECRKHHTPVFLKDNLNWAAEIKEFPNGVAK